MERGMKKIHVKLFLNSQINKWLRNSGMPDGLVKKVKKDILVCGGAISSLMMGTKVNDIDVYFKTKETAISVAEFYIKLFNSLNVVKKEGTSEKACEMSVRSYVFKNINEEDEERIGIFIKSSGVVSETATTYQYFESTPELAAEKFTQSLKKDFEEDPTEFVRELRGHQRNTQLQKEQARPVFISQNAISLSNDFQIVIRFFGSTSQVFSTYDFTHAKCFFDYDTGELNVPAEAMECMLSKSLVYSGSLYPLCSMFRVRKFLQRGWRISAGQMLKIAMQIQKIDFSNSAVLRDQLTGVDAAFMNQLMQALRDDNPAKIDQAYLTKLIDTIFEDEDC